MTLDTEPAEAGDATVETPAPRARSRWLSFRWDNPLADPVSVAFTSIVLFFLGLGGFDRMRAPLGSGDAVPVYVIAKMWATGAIFGNNELGYPFGQDLRYFPAADITQNLMSGVVAALTNDPFLGLNTMYALSFPLTALAALWVLRVCGLRGPMAVLASLALTFIPFHWLRTEHMYLASMYSAVLGVGLALAVGSGAVERALRSEHRVRAALGYGFVVLVVATSGVYYAVFAVLFCTIALVVRFARGARWRSLALSATPPALVVALFGLALLPAAIFERTHPALHPVAKRLVVESVQYAGSLSLALMPAPYSRVPGMGPVNSLVDGALAEGTKVGTSGVILPSNFGSLFTCVAIVFAIVGLIITSRRKALGLRLPGSSGDGVSFGLVGALLSTAVLFFVPWGLNFLFAYLVSTQIRAWDRLLPVLYTLVFAAAAVAWRRLGLPSSGWRTTLVAAGLGVVLILDAVAPYRIQFTQIAAAGAAERAAGEAYADELNAAVPGECGVLQLPVLRYPEEPPKVNLWPLQQFWPALTNPTKKWSAGAMKDTEDSAWLDSLHGDITTQAVDYLVAGGFCAISVDLRGYTPEQQDVVLAQLTEVAGEPVATGRGGDWVAFALPVAQDGEVTDPATDLEDLPDEEQLFWSPAVFENTDGSLPEQDGDHERWWLGTEPARFTVRSTEPDADFTSVTLDLSAAPCVSRDVVVSLTADGKTVSTTVDLEANGEAPVTVSLPSATTDATLDVAPGGRACTVPDDPRKLTVAVLDPVASFR